VFIDFFPSFLYIGLSCHCDLRPGIHPDCLEHTCSSGDICYTLTGLFDGREVILSDCIDTSINPFWEENCNESLNTPTRIYRCCSTDNCNAEWHTQDLAAANEAFFGPATDSDDTLTTITQTTSTSSPMLPTATPNSSISPPLSSDTSSGNQESKPSSKFRECNVWVGGVGGGRL
jgi:hypothetical protein